MSKPFWFWLFLAMVLGSTTGLRAAGKAERIQELVSQYERYGYLNGAVLVAERGHVIYERGVGEANMELHTPNTPQTKFDIASITKQFTAVLVLQQVAEGKIRLEGKVSDYLPWYRRDTGERMTIEQLMHHTSGLPADFDTPEFSQSEAAAFHYDPGAFAQKYCQPGLSSTPGTKWEYSNCGYDLLGLILEQVTGRAYGDLLRERLLQPLGMRNSGLDHNDLAPLGGALGYLRHAGPRYTPGAYVDRSHIFSAGQMYSTVEDLFVWSRAFSEDGFVPQNIRTQIFQPGLNNWGYGWFVSRIASGPGAGSTLEEMRGDMPGNYFAWILRYPEQDDVIIVLRNVYGSSEGLEQNLQAILFDQDPREPSRHLADAAARLWQVSITPPALYYVLGLLAVFGAVRFAKKKPRTT